jgi:hypothetical protein
MNLAKLAVILTTAAISACFAGQADGPVDRTAKIWEPPTDTWPEDLPAATVPKEIITTLQVGKMPIRLEETKLEAAQKILGGAIGSRGDAGDALGWLCLKGADADGKWVLWLESGEIDGPNIGGFEWLSVAPNAVFDPRCHSVRKADGGVKFPVPIRLNMSESQLLSLLGPPTKKWGDTVFYLHEHEEMVGKEPFTASNSVKVVIHSGRVTKIQAWKDTTN